MLEEDSLVEVGEGGSGAVAARAASKDSLFDDVFGEELVKSSLADLSLGGDSPPAAPAAPLSAAPFQPAPAPAAPATPVVFYSSSEPPPAGKKAQPLSPTRASQKLTASHQAEQSAQPQQQSKPQPQAKIASSVPMPAPIDSYYSSKRAEGSAEDGTKGGAEGGAGGAGGAGEDEFEQHERESQEQGMHGAIPMDKLKNGAANALSFLSWGWQKVEEKGKELAANENVRQASARVLETYETSVKPRVLETYETSVKPGLERAKASAAPIIENAAAGAAVAYEKAAEKVKPAFEDLRDRSRPVVSELSEKASEGWEVTKVKAWQAAEACRPGLDRAAESTRAAFRGDGHGGSADHASPPDGKPPSGGSATSPFADI
jgi:hypothetical protein